MLQRLAPEAGVSNEALAFRVGGRLDAALLAEALDCVVSRHEALRTLFPEAHGEPAAVVLRPQEARVVLDVHETDESTVHEAMQFFAARPFPLESGPPLRVGLWRTEGGDYCCLAFHHLAYDAWTAGIVFGELRDAYEALRTGGPRPPREPVPAVREPVSDPAALAYWRSHIAGIQAAEQRLAMGRPDPQRPTFAGAVRHHRLSPVAVAATRDAARRWKVTESMVHLAAYYLLLARHGAGPDLVVGVSADVRGITDRQAVGYHVNTLPLRLVVDLTAPVGELVRRVGEVFLTGLGHRHVPYEAVLPGLETVGSSWRTPLFRHMFNYRPVPVPLDAQMGGLPVELLGVKTGYSRHDLEFIVESGDKGANVQAVYSTEIFEDAEIEALQLRYDAILAGLVGDDRPAGEVRWWSERDERIAMAGDRTSPAPPATPVATAVAAAARAAGDSIALVDGPTEYTYGELAAAAATVHARLLQAGVGPGGLVAVCAARGFGLAAATLGIWEAGAAYLPLHPETPEETLAFQLRDSAADLLLADEVLPAGFEVPCPVLPLAQILAAQDVRSELQGVVDPAARSYVIYTSGSTGRPKGVELSHANLANVVAHFRESLLASPADAMLWLTAFSFDISALELFLPLSCGGRVVVAPDSARADMAELVDLATRHDVRLLQATPTTLATAARIGWEALSGRTLLCGGEPMTEALAADLLRTGCRLINVYGPTETAIWSTSAELRPGAEVTVGRPVRETAVHVAAPDGSALPPGLAGEVCIGGAGVAIGYLNRPDLTADRFRSDPSGRRCYRTGDRGRWRFDGRLELLGRTDRQVKIRSHRLELGEVESVFASHPRVSAAAVVLRTDMPEQSRLVAFVQWDKDGADSTDDTLARTLWDHARGRLPSYALPGRIVLGSLPVNRSGKVDYPALARVPLPAEQRGAAPHRQDTVDSNEQEAVQLIVALWREVLEDPSIEDTDNFFLAGGHSMVAVRMLSRLAAATGVRLTLGDLLEAPTPAELAGRVGTEVR
ncbi:hypothetical protein GCM10009661_27050 [Catellatospora chokoriensis]|uniref:Carrier domain-containing protein n=2 Tax=Catellatospora chokoriensis TaxID=310353 RepID=A0A8J3JZ90_9ACTN|nr:hypothetical protein Cch02nite_10920 [Catellatospora chokoriensis]